jgi:hypothetical protein
LSETVTLPPGCAGFTTASGRTIKAKPGGTVTLEDHDATALLKSQHASIGLVTRQSHRLGTKSGRWCLSCRRLWQAWTRKCPKCHEPTVPEE